MNSNKSTEAQRRFIDSLVRGMTSEQIRTILEPAFRANGNSWELGDTLNQKISRLSKTAASKCIELLKNQTTTKETGQ